MNIINDTIQVHFDYAQQGLTDYNKGLHQFEAAGKDKVFYPAEAILTSYGVAVFCKEVKKHVALRYAFKNW